MEARQVLLGCLCWCAVATLPGALPRAHALSLLDRSRALQSQSAPGVADPDAWWKSQFKALLDKEVGQRQHGEQGEASAELERQHVIGTYNLLRAHGYPVEKHTARTDDGYLLGMFRVPRPGSPVVFLMHGLLASSADYVLTGPSHSLALVLYDAGYDVWLGNARGTTESRHHEKLDPADAAFWDFSWHEIGTHDLPAMIDYVLSATGQVALHYVGHSQGTTTFFVMGSERPEYMPKIKTFSALAPVAFVRDIRSIPLRMMALAPDTLALLVQLLGVHELLPRSDLIEWLGDTFCADGNITQPICYNLVFLICGFDSVEMNATLLPDVLANTPAGASTKQLLHYGQNMRSLSLTFRKFSHGWLGNLKRYGSVLAPEYDLRRVTAPTYLFYSDNDLLAVGSNVDKLMRTLPNIAPDGLRRVPQPKFNHLDFILAKDVKRLINEEVVSIINAFEANPTVQHVQ